VRFRLDSRPEKEGSVPAAKHRTPPATNVAQTGPRERPFPIDGYEELSVAQVLPRVAGLNRAQLLLLREFERRHGNRRSVLEALERALA
jgi:hypothetical protein